jgi:hypothetical protein
VAVIQAVVLLVLVLGLGVMLLRRYLKVRQSRR